MSNIIRKRFDDRCPDWFTALAKSDGPAVFKQIEENYKKYGKCMPF